MIKHVVLWKFADEADGHTKAENMAESKRRLDELAHLVPGIQDFQVGLAGELEHTHDQVLIVTLDSKESLTAYATHPRHVEYAAWLKQRVTQRDVLDFEF
ncbi:MAG: Dabb family protein [Propionibacteriaceae bacterium]|jgi:hypothetical protein|nr:Dabb family protein [Propionibacteriaceae bacterium]